MAPDGPLCRLCCGSKNRVDPQSSKCKSEEKQCTGLQIDSESSSEKLKDNNSTWTVPGIFKNIFHASPDNKLAVKLYGSKKELLLQKKNHEKGSNKWMIHPYSHFRWYWDVIVVILLLFTVIVLPVSIAFYSEDQTNPVWLTLNTIIDVLFITDIIINFRTGIASTDNPEIVILAPMTVAKRYLLGWFVVDFISSVPFDSITLIFTKGENASNSLLKASRALKIIRLAKLISLLRLLRISRLLRFMSRWEDLFDLAGGVLRIVKLIMLMLLLAHWNGCIQFLVPYLQEYSRTSWIAIYHLQNATVAEKYSWSLFKAISHMLCIGFGRWPPQNMTDVWLTIVSMMTGATFYALFIGNMSTLLLSIDSSGRLYNEKLSQVEEYMRYRKLPQNIRLRVQEFYEHRYRKKYFDEELILDELSAGLRQDIISHNCKDLVKTVPFLQNASTQFVTAILTKLQFEVFLKGEYIVYAGAKGDKMYFIRSGIVEVLNDNDEIATTLSDGSHFGEICLLTDDRRVASIRTTTICDLFSLSKINFQKLLEEFPEMRCTLETVALHRLNFLGKEPKAEEIKKHGRLSTVVPPPHISKDTLYNHDDIVMQCDHVAECACCPTLPEELEKDESLAFTPLDPHGDSNENGVTDNQTSSNSCIISSEHSTTASVNSSQCKETDGHHSTCTHSSS